MRKYRPTSKWEDLAARIARECNLTDIHVQQDGKVASGMNNGHLVILALGSTMTEIGRYRIGDRRVNDD